jgi:DNA-binding transcriptional LysR family regulator
MDKLTAIQHFLEVASSRSFTAAAQRLGTSRSNVSKHVAWLEKTMGLQLLRRSTKQVSLTQAGQSMFDKGQSILQLVDDTEHEVRRSVSSPVGVLRIGTPPSFGAVHLVPALSDFCKDNPGIQVETYFDDGRADIITENLDISIRIAAQFLDSSLVAYRLTPVPQYLVAAPSYIADRPPIVSPLELSSHNCLVHTLKSPTQYWSFHHTATGEPISVRVRGTIRSTFGEALRHSALLGDGIAMHPAYMVAHDLQRGDLQIVLPDYRPTELLISAVVASRKHQPLRVQMAVEFLREWFANRSW